MRDRGAVVRDVLLDSTEAARELGTTIGGLDWWRVNRGLRGIENPVGILKYRLVDIENARKPAPVAPSARALAYVLITAGVAVVGGIAWAVAR